MSIASEMHAESEGVVVVGGYHFRVRRVCSLDLVREGQAVIAAIPHETKAKVRNAKTKAARSAELAELFTADPKAQEQGVGFMRALVAAGVVAASRDGVTWEAFQVVLDPAAEDLEKNRVLPWRLPSGAEEALAEAINHLSTEGGKASTMLARFHGGAARGAGRSRPKVRG